MRRLPLILVELSVNPVDPTFQQLVNGLGPDLALWISNREIPSTSSAQAVWAMTPDEQEELLPALLQCASAANSDLGVLARYRADLGTSLPNFLRRTFGGELATPTSDDPVVRPLQQIAADAFGGLLVRESVEARGFAGDHARHHILRRLLLVDFENEHPAIAEFQAALEDDPIAEIFGGRTNTYAQMNDGSGKNIERDAVHFSLLGTAELLARILSNPLSPSQLLDQISEAVDRLRILALEREAEIPVVISFTGTEISFSGSIRTALGDFAHLSLPPGHFSTQPGGTSTMALVAPIGVKMVFGENPSVSRQNRIPASPFRSFEAIRNQVEAIQTKAALAVLCASDADQPDSIVPTTFTLVDPFAGTGLTAAGPQPHQAVVRRGSSNLNPKESIPFWSERVASDFHPDLGVAARRVNISRVARAGSDDALVDSVIAMEALFSSRSATRFKVSACTALLLAPENELEREALFDVVGRAYASRNQVVHGGEANSNHDPIDTQEVQRLVVRCLKTLLTDRCDLIHAGDRAKTIILNTRPNQAPSASASRPQ